MEAPLAGFLFFWGSNMFTRTHVLTIVMLAVGALLGDAAVAKAQAPGKTPNILVIFGDDIGIP
jgi:hypothetical protein